LKYYLLTLFLFTSLYSQTIKDISNVIGIRDNQLIGYGLVVGLAGTGDKSEFTMQSLQNLLRNSYIKIPSDSIDSKNIAAVMVTGKLPPFSRQGDKIKVKVSTIGDSKSIDHGELLITQLKGVDGNVYALSQGTIVANTNNKTTGFIYEGATVENEIPFSLQGEDSITLSLYKSSAKNADLVETKINKKFGRKLALALDTDFKKKIIIDMNRESIISGSDIKISPVTIARDSFTIRIKQTELNNEQWDDRRQNRGVDIGDDVKIANKAIIDIDNAMINTKQAPTVSDLVRAMKVMKLPMTEIIDTLKMIQEMGAIDVEFEIRG